MPPHVLAVELDGLDNITYSIEGSTFGGGFYYRRLHHRRVACR